MKSHIKFSIFIFLFVFIISCCHLPLVTDCEVTEVKKELVSLKLDFLQLRSDIIKCSSLPIEDVEFYYKPMVDLIQLEMNTALELARNVDEKESDHFKKLKFEISEIKQLIDLTRKKFISQCQQDNSSLIYFSGKLV